jgi:uncharacterized protein (DUF433 family)
MPNATISIPLHENADGALCVSGTRVTLDTLITAFDDGASVEEIALRYPSLQLADVYSAISYYLQKREHLQDYLQQRKAEAATIRQQNESRFRPDGIRTRLLQRRSTS